MFLHKRTLWQRHLRLALGAPETIEQCDPFVASKDMWLLGDHSFILIVSRKDSYLDDIQMTRSTCMMQWSPAFITSCIYFRSIIKKNLTNTSYRTILWNPELKELTDNLYTSTASILP